MEGSGLPGLGQAWGRSQEGALGETEAPVAGEAKACGEEGGHQGGKGFRERKQERRMQKNQDKDRGPERETQMQRASREGKAKGKKTKPETQRSSDRHTERKQRTRRKRTSERREEGVPPHPQGVTRPWAASQLGLGCLPAGCTLGQAGTAPIWKQSVPQGGGCGEEARHEPCLERGSSRVLQRPELAGTRGLHRLASQVWYFSVGREDRALCSRGLCKGTGRVGLSERSPTPTIPTSVQMKTRGPRSQLPGLL